MKRPLGIVIALAVVIAAIWWWRSHGADHADDSHAGDSHGATTVAPAGDLANRRDPRTLTRASIAGTIKTTDGAPIPHARVCGDASSNEMSDEVTRDPRCTNSDEHGAYLLDNLLVANYDVVAMAKPFVPGAFQPPDDARNFHLAAGEHKTGVDIVLEAGGVELTGTVADVSGGPISHAQVRTNPGWRGVSRHYGPMVESDDQGKFSFWVRPGELDVGAVADGYAPGSQDTRAPGKVEILLTPESSLAGTVVDAKTGAPVEGVRVTVQGGDSWGGDDSGEITDEAGKFRVTRLTPGRFVATARSPHGYGHTDGSTLVGLGQHVDGVVVKLFPAMTVQGKVMIAGATKTPCKDGTVYMNNVRASVDVRRDEDGTQTASGVLPGTYDVTAYCRGYSSREKYDSIKVETKDITGLEWLVDPGATIHGHVTSKSGTPLEGVDIWASTTGGAARASKGYSNDHTSSKGEYKLAGLRPGHYKIAFESDRAVAPVDGIELDVASGATIEKDLILDDGGTITGSVVDADGKPVADISVEAHTLAAKSRGSTSAKSGDDGTFEITAVGAGEYRVAAQRGWSNELRKPGTNDDAKQGETITVKAGQTSTVKLVVEAQGGTIKGTVLGADHQPVVDAFVSAARESDAAGAGASSVGQTRWTWDERPVLTTADGSFTVTKLAPGNYTVRAYRKGGGEAVAEHVAVGGTAQLQIKPTGSLDGTVHRDGGAPDEIAITITNATTGFRRREQFFKTGGHYTVNDLPEGHYQVNAQSDGGQKLVETDLADGEHKTGVDLELVALLTVTGRVVDSVTNLPVAGIQVYAQSATGGEGIVMFGGGDRTNVSDDSGAFTIKNAPAGQLRIMGMSKDWSDSEYGWITVYRTVSSSALDLGDLPIVKKRVKPGDPIGELGMHFKTLPPDTKPEQGKLEVAFIDPSGPAAKIDIKVGDVVTSVDGTDATGVNMRTAQQLMQAPPGTGIKLGLARGTTVTLVLAAP